MLNIIGTFLVGNIRVAVYESIAVINSVPLHSYTGLLTIIPECIRFVLHGGIVLVCFILQLKITACIEQLTFPFFKTILFLKECADTFSQSAISIR